MFVRPEQIDFIHKALAGRPRTLAAVVGTVSLLTFGIFGWIVWFSYGLTAGLPDKSALRSLGEMARATTLYDATDKPVFTIFKEQRLEVPLERVSPNLIKAVLSVEDQRFYEHRGV